VRLTVTDNDNASSSITHQVTVTAPAGTPFASDAFNRSVTGGWGTADVGGAWVRSGTASAFSVANGSGRMQTAAGATLVEYLGSALSTDTDLVCTFSIDRLPVGGSMYVSITGRRVSSGNTYLDVLEIRPNGTANLRLARTVGGTQTLLQPQLTVPGLTVAANTAITVRLQVTGTSPTTLRTRAWPAGGAEPGQWQLTATDSSAALQAAGSVGLSNYLPAAVTNGPVTVGVDSLVAASSASGPPPNQSPVAAFTSTCTLRSCSFDANGSHDSDGQINSFAWTFGDGDTGSGTNPTHDYRTVGTFTVTLTVTDDDQATGSISHSVTTTQSTGTPVAFVAAAHGPAGSVRTEQVTVPTLAHAGDTMLLFFTHSTTATWTGPAGVTGWTELLTFTQGSIVSTAWTKTVAAGDVGAAVHLDSTGYSKGILELAVYSGASSTTAPIVGHAGDSARSGHVSPTITAAANDLVVTLWTDKSETTTSWAAPAGVTTRDTALGTGGGRYGGLLADSGGPVAAGSYGGLTATTNAASGLGAMWTVALAPAG
jgi:PKD repeat protein